MIGVFRTKHFLSKRVTEESKSSPMFVSLSHFEKKTTVVEEVIEYLKICRADSDSVKAKIALLNGWPILSAEF